MTAPADVAQVAEAFRTIREEVGKTVVGQEENDTVRPPLTIQFRQNVAHGTVGSLQGLGLALMEHGQGVHFRVGQPRLLTDP